MIVAHDTWFYWTHRAMHRPRLFRVFHRTHHLSRTPTPWTAYSFSVPEALVQGAFVPLFLLLVPTHYLGIVLFLGIQIVQRHGPLRRGDSSRRLRSGPMARIQSRTAVADLRKILLQFDRERKICRGCSSKPISGSFVKWTSPIASYDM
jgi:hypothetical protein